MSVDSLGMYKLYNNPYFLQALNTPNINAQAVQQNLNQNQTNTAQTVTEDDLSTGNSPSFNGASEAIAENTKKSNTAANLILWGATLAATIWGGYKCHGKGVGENMFAKILDGAKQYWNKGIDAISKWKFNQKVAEPNTPRNVQAIQQELPFPNNANAIQQELPFPTNAT